MSKDALRKKYIQLRQTLSISEVEEKSLKLANKLLELHIWDQETFHIFLTISEQKEIKTEYILQIIYGKDANAVVPKVDGAELKHFLLTDTTKLKLSKWGIPEPTNGIPVDVQNIDVVFIPLLAYDMAGHRIGYGKGFYDKFLSKCKDDVIKVGLSFFEPENQLIEASAHDVKLDYCVSPEKCYKFN